MMNNKSFHLVILLILFSGRLFCQYNVISIDALSIGSRPFSVLRGSYERSLGKNFAVLFGAEKGKYGTIESSGFSTSSEVAQLTGWGFMPQARFYPFTKKRKSPLGLFIGAHYRYRRLVEEYYPLNLTTKAKAHNYGINFGYKGILKPLPITFELLIGFGGAKGIWDEPNNRDQITGLKSDLTDENNSMRLEISIGFIFPNISKKE